jgi:hypothetical protein
VKEALEPDLNFLEFEVNYELKRVHDELYVYAPNKNWLRLKLLKMLDELDPKNLPPEKGPYDKVQEFITLYTTKLDTQEIWRVFHTELWKEVKAILKPIYDTPGYIFYDYGNPIDEEEEDLEDVTLRYSEPDPVSKAQRKVRTYIQALSNPVLTTEIRSFLGDGFIDPEFTEEFTSAKRHANPKLVNYGYILALRQPGFCDHAVCVIRQYPFATFGEQSLLVLDSGQDTVLSFPNYIEMKQQLLKRGLTSLRAFISIYGYSKKQYEQTERRQAILQKYREVYQSLSTLAAGVASAAAGGAAAGGGGGGAAAGGGGGGGDETLEGGQTFYSFYTFN